MKQITKIIGFALAISLAFFAAGCSAVSGNPSKKSDNTTNKFTLSGTIALGGAYPTELSEALNQAVGKLDADDVTSDIASDSISDARIATSSFTKLNSGKPKFSLEAKKADEPDAESIYNGSVTKSADGSFNYSFTFDLPTGDDEEKWELSAYLYFTDRENYSYVGTVPVTLTKEGIKESVPQIVLTKYDTVAKSIAASSDPDDPNDPNSDPDDPNSDPENVKIDPGVPGGINLKIYSEIEDIEYVVWECDLDGRYYDVVESDDEYVRTWLKSIYVTEDESWNECIYFEDGVATFKSRNVPNGVYTGGFSFYKFDEDEPFLVIPESIYVYPGYVTDSWYASNQSYIKKDSESGEYKFVITQELLNNYSTPAREIKALDTPYVLWSRDDGHIFEPFDSIDSNTALSPFAYSYSNDDYSPKFWFGLVDGTSNKYTIYYDLPNSETKGILNSIEPSYASGVFKEKQGALNLQELVKETKEYKQYGDKDGDGIGDDVEICSYNITANYVYIYWKDSSDRYYFTMYKLGNFENSDSGRKIYTAVVLEPHDDFVVNNEWFEDDAELYVYYLSSDKKQIIQQCFKNCADDNLELGMEKGSDDKLTEVKNIYKLTDDLDKDDEADVYTGNLMFSDLLAQDGVVYALVKGYGSKELDTNPNTPTSSNTKFTHYSSTGGVIRFSRDVIDSPEAWENGSIIYGLYTDLGDQMYYQYYKMEITDLPMPGQPPLAEDDKYFYGAQRFVARKPDKLVIADDGGYVGEEENTSKKRVVTIDLSKESMSVTDVNVSFTTRYYSSITNCYGESLD